MAVDFAGDAHARLVVDLLAGRQVFVVEFDDERSARVVTERVVLVLEPVEFAFANPKSGLEFIRSHSQEMSEEVMYKHIELYVNKYSVDLGDEGRNAVSVLFDGAVKLEVIPEPKEKLFL